MANQSKSNVPKGRGHVGEVIDSNVEGTGPEGQTIRKNPQAQGNKSAGTVGSSSVNHS